MSEPDRTGREMPARSSIGTPRGFDMGDVLIRSTRAPLPDRGPGPFQITVQNLSEPPRVQQPESRHRPRQKPGISTPSRAQAGEDMVTSRFTCGGRSAVLAALKQRSHRKEVKVQLLTAGNSTDAPALSSQDAAGEIGEQLGAGPPAGYLMDAGNTAAAAAMAPIMKVHSQMEARVSQLVDDVQKLLQTDRGSGDRGRSLDALTQQHLEELQRHQLDLQSQLLQSALRIVTGHAHPQATQHEATASVLTDQRFRVTTASPAMETSPVAMETHDPDQGQEQARDTPSLPESLANHSQEAVGRANELLREMRGLRAEMKMLLKPPEETSRPAADPPELKPVLHRSHKHQAQQEPVLQGQQQSQQVEGGPVQRGPSAPSLLEEAAQVLRQVRRQKKVLEENLQSVLRSRDAEVLHSQLEALSTNSDWNQQARIRRTVDAWINVQLSHLQVLQQSCSQIHINVLPLLAELVETGGVALLPPAVAGHQKLRPPGKGKSVSVGSEGGRGLRRETAERRAPEGAEPQSAAGSRQMDGEAYLTRLYGRAPYEGLRRTLKKSPYLRFSSPTSPMCRKPRPRLVESVRGVKLKSCKTQTMAPPPTTLAPPPVVAPALPWAPPVALAPPLRSSLRRTVFSSSHMTPGDLTVTPADSHCPVTMAIPLGCTRLDSSARRRRPPAVMSSPAMLFAAPEQQRQLDADEAPPPPVTSHTTDIIVRRTEEDQEEEEDEKEAGEEEEGQEEDTFPGTHFGFVADVVQEEVGEGAVEMKGGPTPPPILYQGPVFPPQAPTAPSAQDQDQGLILGLRPQRDSLEDRLVEWVEQQLMSQMISQMSRPPPSDPAQNGCTDQSDVEKPTAPSDIVEAAGGEGLQLFVDSGISVDSDLIRRMVTEVLTEMVTRMLGEREAVGPEPGQDPEDKLLPLLDTAAPTPPASPTLTSKEATPTATPPPPAAEPVTMPTLSPDPAPSAGSPVNQAPPPFTWGDVELPLDKETPEDDMDTHKELLMSVVEEEPPPSTAPPSPTPSPLPPPPPAPQPSLTAALTLSSAHEPGPVYPSTSSSPSSYSSSSSSSSSVTADTEAALKHISEGELLLSIKQPPAMTVAAGCSSSGSLQDMDFDPASEGQVKGRDLLLSQPAPSGGERPELEGSWEQEEQQEEMSVGEVRHQAVKPNSTANQTSPGQVSQAADELEFSFKGANQALVPESDLTVEPMGTLTSDLLTDRSLSPLHLENTHTAGQVVLLCGSDSVAQQQEEVMEEGGAAPSDSSSDIF